MQASIYLPSPIPSSLLSLPSTKASSPIRQLGQTSTPFTSLSVKAAAAASSENSQVDYSSMASSVFPAEACETVGGDACDVEMFPETKMKQQPLPSPLPTPKLAEAVDREYLDYNTPKTVFISEACDDLGGEFCEPAYQSEVN